MEISQSFVYLVPIVLGMVQAAKMAGMSSKYAPALSVLLGMAFGVGVGQADFSGIIQGIAIGLSASGLFSGGKAMLNKDEYL